jgi:hypothetical protein
MKKRTIRKLPARPDQITLNLLTRATAFQRHAVSHITLNSPIDRMVAIHGLDNSVEYLLRIVNEHLDIESRTGRNFDTVDLAGLAAEINSFLRTEFKIQLPYLTEIKRLRQVRNLVQHSVVDPVAELERFEKIVERFSSSILSDIFGVDKNNLRTSFLILDEKVRSHLSEAETLIEKDPLRSIVASRDAYENAYFKVASHSRTRWDAIPAAVRAQKDSLWIGEFINSIRDQLDLTNLGVDLRRHGRFQDYLNHIPSEHRAEKWGHFVMQRPWSAEDAQFCYQFVADTVLKWQNEELQPLYTPTFSKEYKYITRIADVEVAHEDSMEWVSFEGNDEIVSYVVAGDVADKLQSLNKGKIYKHETDVFEDSVLRNKLVEQIRLLWVSKRLLTNNPARWEIVLWYERVPLTWKRQDFLNGKLSKESPCINTADTKEIQAINDNIIDLNAAQAVVDFRNRVGSIQSKDDLKQIKQLNDEQLDWIARFSRAVP